MTRRGLLLIAAAGVALAAGIGVVVWRARTAPAPPSGPGGFERAAAPVDSPDLDLEVARIVGRVEGDQLSWLCALRCQDPAGCRAMLRVTVYFRSGSTSRSVTFVGTSTAARGEETVVGGVQRPAPVVDDIERVEVVVEQRLEPGQSTPIVDM